MRSRVYGTVRCPFVRPTSVCPIDRQQQRHAAGLLLSATRAGDIDRPRRAPSSTAFSGKCEQCHVYSRRRMPNIDLLSHFNTTKHVSYITMGATN